MARYKDPMFDSSERRGHPALVFVLLVLVILLVAGFGINVLNNNRVRLVEQNVTVNGLPSALEGFRILHISDLNGRMFGANQERLMLSVGSRKYNAVCITGDVTGKNGNAEAFLALIDAIPEGIPIFFISGDQDPTDLSAQPRESGLALADYIVAAQERGAIYLDAPQKMTVGKATIWFSPESLYAYNVDSAEKTLRDRVAQLMEEEQSLARDAAVRAVEYQIDRNERIRAARLEMLSTDTHIALTHYPLGRSALLNLKEVIESENDSFVQSISLLMAGHFVAGQWRLPGIGAVCVPPATGLGSNGWFPGDVGVCGISYSLGITQYISPGLGVSDDVPLPPFRLFNTPTVTLLKLTAKLGA